MHFLGQKLLAGALVLALATSNDEVQLKGGALIRGAILKETPEDVFVDVGHTIVTVPRSMIVTIRRTAKDVVNDEAKAAVAQTSAGDAARLWREAPPTRPELSVRENVERIGAGVCLVRVPGALGSGFVTTETGHVVTNAHVVEGERNVSLTFFLEQKGSDEALAKKVIEDVEILAVNPYWDLALLRIPEKQLEGIELTPIPFGRFEDLVVGDPVFAVGSPLGLERTVSEGIVSTKNRAMQGQLYVQTTAPINPGNSGGPLFNLKGEMVGVTTWTYLGTEGLNFAIPVTTVRTFLQNHEAFAFDKEQANAGYRYLRPPRKGGTGEE